MYQNQQGYDGSSSGGPYASPSNFAGGPPPGYAGGPPPPGYAGGPPPGYGGVPPQGFPGGYDPSMGSPPQSFMGGPPPQQMSGQSFQQGHQPQMMGQPPMGYDPESFAIQQADPQSFAMQQAEAELAALEDKRNAHLQKEKQHDVEHLTHKIRSGTRDQKDNQACARQLAMWGVFNGLMYGLALMGDSWWTVAWHATGIDQMSITVGLFNLNVDLQCKDAIDMKQCNMMKRWTDHDGGVWSTLELRETMCSEDKASCTTMDRLYYAGFAPLLLLPAAAAFECLSLLLLYFYWHVKPTSMTRILADKCGLMGCLCGAFGIVSWFAIKPWLTGLPQIWARMAGHADASRGVFNGFKEIWGIPLKWCLICALLGMVGNFGRVILQYNLPFHVDEPDPYGLDESMHFAADAKAEAERLAYGTG